MRARFREMIRGTGVMPEVRQSITREEDEILGNANSLCPNGLKFVHSGPSGGQVGLFANSLSCYVVIVERVGLQLLFANRIREWIGWGSGQTLGLDKLFAIRKYRQN